MIHARNIPMLIRNTISVFLSAYEAKLGLFGISICSNKLDKNIVETGKVAAIYTVARNAKNKSK